MECCLNPLLAFIIPVFIRHCSELIGISAAAKKKTSFPKLGNKKTRGRVSARLFMHIRPLTIIDHDIMSILNDSIVISEKQQ